MLLVHTQGTELQFAPDAAPSLCECLFVWSLPHKDSPCMNGRMPSCTSEHSKWSSWLEKYSINASHYPNYHDVTCRQHNAARARSSARAFTVLMATRDKKREHNKRATLQWEQAEDVGQCGAIMCPRSDKEQSDRSAEMVGNEVRSEKKAGRKRKKYGLKV